ncbi:MAG: lysylphosphatidylglycerol synthase transmembrane domain-containing protein, partial [Bacteroidota bacterium]
KSGRLLLSFIVMAYIIWYVLHEQSGWDWPVISWREVGFIALALVFLPINLGLETLKWQELLQEDKRRPSFQRLFQGVLAGISLGIFTPNRIGEYAGRLMFLPPQQRWRGAIATWINRLDQMLITLAIGLVSLYGLREVLVDVRMQGWAPWGSLVSLVWIACVGLAVFLFAHKWTLQYFPLPKSWKLTRAVRETGESMEWRQMMVVTGLSLLRYTAFSLQYVWLLYAFGFEGTLALAWHMIALVFLIKSLAPIASIAELGIREAVALTIMGYWAVAPSTILAATLALYVINLVLPSTAGLYVLMKGKNSTDFPES